MNEMLGFWIASSAVLFLLSVVYFRENLHRKNSLFGWWLSFGVAMQLVSAYGMLLAFPGWMYRLWPAADWLSYGLAAAVLLCASSRRACPVNQTLLYGLGSMVAFSLGVRWLGAGLGPGLQSWLLNIAFLGPALFLLVAFSNIRADRLPLHIHEAIRALRSQSAGDGAVQTV
ncbi:MAG: hypothetical protein KGM47_18120 [Acidobacteriota bacterium]|nr:hypothetical protein [Acidobacteriota bacterium]